MSEDMGTVDIPESPDRDTRVQELTGQTTSTIPEQVTEQVPVVEEVPVVEKPQTAKVVQKFDVSRPADKWDETDDTLAIPSGTLEEIKTVAVDGPNIRLDDNPAGREWGESLQNSVDVTPIREIFKSTAERPTAEYHQVIESEKMPLSAGIPNLKYNDGDKVAGERAVLRVRSLLGMGTILQIPLWHSGFWITIKAPTEASLLELQRRIIEEKVNLGRQTHGLAFANTSVYIAGMLMDFVMAHIYDTTIRGEVNVRQMIKSTDIPAIVWGLACTIWPSGFQYTRSCIADPEKCNHVIRERLNLSKIFWVDQSSLTKRQIAHMTNRGGSSMSLEMIETYQNEFLIGRERTISLDEAGKIKITLKVPNIDEYLNSGYNWISNIVQMIDSAMTQDQNDTARNYHITELGKATNMRQYSHWIESIDADGSPVEDHESIDLIVDALSTEDEIRKKYFNEVIKFIDDSTMAIVAVPTFECPKCKQQQPVSQDRFPHLLPIDVISSFFTLLVQKLQKIRIR